MAEESNSFNKFIKDSWEIILKHTNLIRNICNQVLSLVHDSNFIVLFPRMDFKGFGYVPQLFFIMIKEDYLDINISSTSSDKAIINYESRKAEYASYNVVTQPETISLSRGILTSIYEEALIEPLKLTIFGNSVLRFSKNLVKQQFLERFKAGVYYSMFSPTIGFYEAVTLSSLSFKDTPWIDEIEINLSIKVLKTFSLDIYEG